MLRTLVALPLALGLHQHAHNGTVLMQPSIPTDRTSTQSSSQCETLLKTVKNNEVFAGAARILEAVCTDALRTEMHGLQDGCLYMSESTAFNDMTRELSNIRRGSLRKIFENSFFKHGSACPTDKPARSAASSLGGFSFTTCEGGFTSADGACVPVQFVDHDTASNVKLFVVQGRIGVPNDWSAAPSTRQAMRQLVSDSARQRTAPKPYIDDKKKSIIAKSQGTQNPRDLPSFKNNNLLIEWEIILCSETEAKFSDQWKNIEASIDEQVLRLNDLFRGAHTCPTSGHLHQVDTHIRFAKPTVNRAYNEWCSKATCAEAAKGTGHANYMFLKSVLTKTEPKLKEEDKPKYYDPSKPTTAEPQDYGPMKVVVCDLGDQEYTVVNPASDAERLQKGGIAMNFWNMLGAPDLVGINNGVSLARAFAAYFGLCRTYGGGCLSFDDSVKLSERDGCVDGGDQIDDTEPQKHPNYVCMQPADADSCGSGDTNDPIFNTMDATPDDCVCGFTRGQTWRMWVELWENHPDIRKFHMEKRKVDLNRRTQVPTSSPTAVPR